MTKNTKVKGGALGADSGSEGGVHVFKTTLAGNGGLYGWKEMDENGDLVRESTQTYNSEADAEKAIRTLVSSKDIVEVSGVKNINSEANTNVNLVKKDTRDDNFGMNVVSRSVEVSMSDLDKPAKEEEHPNVAKMPAIDEAIDAKVEDLQAEKDAAEKAEAERVAKLAKAEDKKKDK